MATKRPPPPELRHNVSVSLNEDGDVDVHYGGDFAVCLTSENMDRLCKWWPGDAETATQPTWRDITVTPGAGGSVTIRFDDGGTSK